MSILGRMIKALKPEQIRHSSGSNLFGIVLPRTKINYANEVGDMTGSSVVMDVIQWIQRAAQEADFRVVDSDGAEIEGHLITALVRNPNAAYSQSDMLNAAIFDYLTSGNGYWLPAANGGGIPVELWYAPAATLTPKFPKDGSEFISYWEYKPSGSAPQKLKLDDVIHFRHGIDPGNMRLGMSPLKSVLREIFVDLEASNFSASMLRNMGTPGMVLSPKHEQQMTPDEAAAVKKWIAEAFRGDRRGEPLVMGMPTEVSEYGYSPDKMALSAVRNVAEERVCAALGIPAAVVGFGTGLASTKVGATMAEMRKLAWVNGINPILQVFADRLTLSLLTEKDRSRGVRCLYDTTDVVALQADEKLRTERWDIMVRGSWATRAEAREAAGLETTPSDEVYLTTFSTIEVQQGKSMPTLDADPKALTKAKTDRGLTFVRQLRRMERAQADNMARKLRKVFADLGKSAGAALNKSRKLTEDDKTLMRRVIAEMGIPEHRKSFEAVYEAHYLEVAGDVNGAMGLAVNMPDPVARSVISAGGTRAGLVDLEKQTKDAMFKALTDGRADGLGADALARKIRDGIEAGPWSTSSVRAKVIARTETKFAQNSSTVALAVDAGIDKFVVHDGLLGEEVASDDPNGAPAMAFNIDSGGFEPMADNHAQRGQGQFAVSAAEAASMTSGEHPNGLLSFSPYFEDEDVV